MKKENLISLMLGLIVGAAVVYSWTAVKKAYLEAEPNVAELKQEKLISSPLNTESSPNQDEHSTVGAILTKASTGNAAEDLAICLEQNESINAENRKMTEELEEMGYQQRSLDDSPEIRSELATQLVQTLEIDRSMDKSLEAIGQQFAKAYELQGEDAEGIKGILQRHLLNEEFYDSIEKAYSEVFTPSELNALIRFHQSEVGQNYLAKSPELAEKLTNKILENLKTNDVQIKEEMLAIQKNGKAKQGKL